MKRMIPLVAAVVGVLPVSASQQAADPPAAFVVARDFIYTSAPFPSVHASTIVETPAKTLLTAFFGGTNEGQDDVEIWLSRKPAGQAAWSAPVALTETPNMPTWNPVLFQDGTKTWLFYKVGPSPQDWIGAYRTSDDDGRTWAPTVYMPAGQLGPIRAKPIRLADGTWLAGTSVEAGYRRGTPPVNTFQTWSVWVERSADRGATWTKHGPIVVPNEPFGVIQPTLWQLPDGEVRMFMRAAPRIGRIAMSSSKDGGRTWTPATPTSLPNPNAGIDVVTLADRRLLLIYNHLKEGRNSIHLAVSKDWGTTWSPPIQLEAEDAQLSYPAIIQSADGLVHATYTWKRQRVRYLVIDPKKIG